MANEYYVHLHHANRADANFGKTNTLGPFTKENAQRVAARSRTNKNAQVWISTNRNPTAGAPRGVLRNAS